MNAALLLPLIPYVLSFLAVVGTIYGIRYTNAVNLRLQAERLKAEEKKQNKDLLRAKGEELSALVSQHERELRHIISETALSLSSPLTSQPTFVGDYNETAIQFQRLEMFVKAYFPASSPTLAKLAYREKLSYFTSQLRQSRDRERTQYLIDELLNLGTYVQEYSEALQREIAQRLSELHAS